MGVRGGRKLAAVEQHRMRSRASYTITQYVKSGVMKRMPCEVCGNDDLSKIVGHHEDYAYPEAVNWLCPPCHVKVHRREVRVKMPEGTRRVAYEGPTECTRWYASSRPFARGES